MNKKDPLPELRAVTLQQPWASLIALGAKRIETRSWSTAHRGPIAIHASARPTGRKLREMLKRCREEPFKSALAPLLQEGEPLLPFGSIVALAEIVDCRSTGGGLTPRGELWNGALRAGSPEAIFGSYGPDRFGWFLGNVRMLKEPIACRGSLGLWRVPVDALQRLFEDGYDWGEFD